ncbi:DUF1302 family protein [Fontimonas sp. SYSU GA230001]|uniref:DUF1302 domain-containing protein n=1 Tax=Fontimonas sp. SYSU GA230001 TaxID=3142450 RepID=UPI0032B56D84
MRSSLGSGLALSAWLVASGAAAAGWNVDWGPGFDIAWTHKLAAGAQWRLASRNDGFIGKSNLDPALCAEDACLSLTRDNLEPHQRWMAAPGSAWQLGDEADLTHGRGEVTSAVARWRSDLKIGGGDGSWGLHLGWQAFYDGVLDRQRISNPNLIVEEGPAPGVATTLRAPRGARADNGRQFDLREANVFFRLPSFADREIDVRIGRQYVNWGEALFAISGTLNFVTPVNFNNFFRPTMDLDEAVDPVAMIHLQTLLTDALALEAYYQLEWRPYTLPARGSLGSFIVDIGTEAQNRGELSDDSLPLPFGKTPEDPLQLQRELTPVVGLISDTAGSVPRLDNVEPRADGQYGIRLGWFSEELLGGTEFSVYFARYHARLPAASFIAAQASCTTREGSATGEDVQPAPFPQGLFNFLRACGRDVNSPSGLIGLLQSLNNGDKLVGDGYDALPLSSAALFLEYPEDIQVFGVGFNTAALGLTWTGELAYRPDHPFQVDLEDLVFAALQPAFPRNELPLFPSQAGQLDPLTPLLQVLAPRLSFGQLAGATFTDRRNAVPDHVTAYRGGTPGEVEPGSYIRGYEKFDFWQGCLGIAKILGTEWPWLGADQAALLFELGATYVPGLPPLSVLQLDGLATTNTHFSPGIEETGDALKINPYQTDASGFPTRLAWGYKAAAIWSYDDWLFDGLRLRPQLILFHDVNGITPGLGGNFQDGRKIGLAGLAFNYRNTLGLAFDQFIFFGGGDGNRLRDRDFLNVSVSYQF